MQKKHWTWMGFISLITLTASAFAEFSVTSPNITHYTELVKALEQGVDVKGVVFLSKCTPDPSSRSTIATQDLTDASTRVNFNEYLHALADVDGVKKNIISTSYTTLVERPTGEFWNYYVRYQFSEDNQVDLYVAYFDPLTNQKKLSIKLICAISNGHDQNAVVLYGVQ